MFQNRNTAEGMVEIGEWVDVSHIVNHRLKLFVRPSVEVLAERGGHAVKFAALTHITDAALKAIKRKPNTNMLRFRALGATFIVTAELDAGGDTCIVIWTSEDHKRGY